MNGSGWRILIANRGEIAGRILETVHRRNDIALSVYSTADTYSPHLKNADESYQLGAAPSHESYLSIERVISAGRAMSADAVHPGYGFLSENPEFARAVESEGWAFVGPTPQQLETMGDKARAIAAAQAVGVPIVPSWRPEGTEGEDQFDRESRQIGFPLLVKAVQGGGGKGMRRVDDPTGLQEAVKESMREAHAAFGDGRVYLERLIEDARHIEVQLVGDGQGGVLLLGDRECSLQRRHQKLIEECPAPGLEDSLRDAIHQSARDLASSQSYRGAGTVEFLLAADGTFYFLEMNTRIQVEHPVTEMVFGVDIVDLQIQVARGEFEVANFHPPSASGWAIEARVNAENPADGFLPAVGTVEHVVWPSGEGIRVDSGIVSGTVVSHHYDSLLAKLIVHRPTRESARTALVEAIDATCIAGVQTSLPLCRDLLDSQRFRDGTLTTTMVEADFSSWTPDLPDQRWRQALIAIARHLGATKQAEPDWPEAFQSLKDWRLGQ